MSGIPARSSSDSPDCRVFMRGCFMRPIQPARSLAVALGFFCFPAHPGPFDPLQVYREALVNDAQYTAARATAEAGREKPPQGLAGLLPVIGGTANTVWNENKYRVDHAARTGKEYNTNAYNVSLTPALVSLAERHPVRSGQMASCPDRGEFCAGVSGPCPACGAGIFRCAECPGESQGCTCNQAVDCLAARAGEKEFRGRHRHHHRHARGTVAL